MEQLRLPAVIGSIGEVVRYVAALAGCAELSDRQASGLRLAAEEFVTNVVIHGYGDRPGAVELQGSVESSRVVLRIVDAAPPFDPTLVAAPSDLHRPLAERQPGGLGIYLARSAVDRVTYEYAQCNNRVTLIVDRALPPARDQASPPCGADPSGRRNDGP
jgi:serine/threonine-protein kinase RsbW